MTFAVKLYVCNEMICLQRNNVFGEMTCLRWNDICDEMTCLRWNELCQGRVNNWEVCSTRSIKQTYHTDRSSGRSFQWPRVGTTHHCTQIYRMTRTCSVCLRTVVGLQGTLLDWKQKIRMKIILVEIEHLTMIYLVWKINACMYFTCSRWLE